LDVYAQYLIKMADAGFEFVSATGISNSSYKNVVFAYGDIIEEFFFNGRPESVAYLDIGQLRNRIYQAGQVIARLKNHGFELANTPKTTRLRKNDVIVEIRVRYCTSAPSIIGLIKTIYGGWTRSNLSLEYLIDRAEDPPIKVAARPKKKYSGYKHIATMKNYRDHSIWAANFRVKLYGTTKDPSDPNCELLVKVDLSVHKGRGFHKRLCGCIVDVENEQILDKEGKNRIDIKNHDIIFQEIANTMADASH